MKDTFKTTYKTCQQLVLAIAILLGIQAKLIAQSDYKLAEQDSLALVAFYWATDGPNWTSNQPGFGFNDLSSEWQTTYDGQFNPWFTGPAKDWFGVRVEKRAISNSNDSTYRVTWIWPVIGRRTDGQNQLKGYVPREIGLLTALEHFRVNGNDGFRDELVPDEMYHTSLEHLDPEACWFGGGISDSLRNCIGIRKMNLRYNNFDYMPSLDFLDEAALRNLNGTQWLYNSRFSFAILEKIIDYFYSISPNLQEFRIEMRDMFDVGDEREIVAPLGSAVDIVCNDAGEQDAFITYQWFKNGLSRFGRTQKTYSIPSVSASDYGDYKVRITNDYVKTYDLNTNYGEVFTKEIHLVAQPVPPVIERAVSSYNGQSIDLYFSKPMSDSALATFQNLSLSANNTNISVVSAELFGRIDRGVKIHLDTPVKKGDTLNLALLGSGNIVDKNGGELAPFSALSIENRVRVAPLIAEVKTTLDGSGIVVSFDQFIKQESLSSGTFVVKGDTTYQITSVTLVPGAVDAHISKNVLLTLTESLEDTAEVLTLQYESGSVHGLFGGTVEPSDTIPVLNQISVERLPVTLIFEDGSETLKNLFIHASWKVDPIPMFDDGTHADAVANDHIWTYAAPLVVDNYVWDVFEREEIMEMDTIRSVDPVTGVVTLTITPIVVNKDSLLSEQILLEFSTENEKVTGDTVYGIQNREVIFSLKTSGANEDVFLMGIDEDWANGLLMSELTTGSLYADTLFKMTAGDMFQYNYRIGNDWENLSPEPRSYTVKNGENLIRDEFGVFTGIDKEQLSPLSIYPNPSRDGLLSIEGLERITKIEVYKLSGQFLQTYATLTKDKVQLDLSDQAKGLYILKATTSGGGFFVHKILLQ